MKKTKECGILLPITSLPSNYGIGTLGKCAYEFVDFLRQTNQNYWQVLPINQTGYGDSPYASISVYAGNPYLIDFDILQSKGLLNKDDYCNFKNDVKIDYGYLYNEKYKILEIAFNNFKDRILCDEKLKNQFDNFTLENNFWLDKYATFMCLKKENDNKCWAEWKNAHKNYSRKVIAKKYKNGYSFWQFVQFEFFNQYYDLLNYAHKNNIKIIGDMPIYCAYDSVEVWQNVNNFSIDKKTLKPKKVAGVPPDYFSSEGQLWGNPVYNWNYIKKNNFDFWLKRIEFSLKLYDKVRFDHFRGFDEFYAIDYGATNGKVGKWLKVPSRKLFSLINSKFSSDRFIAEDLGYITPSVKRLLDYTNFPGMKIMLFAFDCNDSAYLPKHHKYNSVVYSGTHDNDTIKGWFDCCDNGKKQFIYKCLSCNPKVNINTAIITSAMKGRSKLVIIPLQDYLKLDSSARINTPSMATGNWTFRLTQDYQTEKLKKYVLKCVKHR